MESTVRSRSTLRAFVLALGALIFVWCPSLLAGGLHEVRGFSEKLLAAKARFKTTIPLRDGKPTEIELEPFQVWAPDAEVVFEDIDGTVTKSAPRPRLFFKGHVAGDNESTVFISINPKDKSDITGLVLVKDRKFVIAKGRVLRGGDSTRPGERDREPRIFVAEYDEIEEVLAGTEVGFVCEIEKTKLSKSKIQFPAEVQKVVETNLGGVAGATYSLKMAVETDGELYAAFGSQAAVETYLANLVGTSSTIYSRDVATSLTLGHTHIFSSSATDPFSASSADGGLAEVAKVWHNTTYHPNFSTDPALTRSAVVFVSGKLTSSGIAWVDAICRAAANDISCGPSGATCGSATYADSYYGAYAFCGSSGTVATTVPDPTLAQNGVQYGIPQTSNFWMLLEFVHELGHIVGVDHTQCTSLTSAEKTAYNIGTPGGAPDRNFVDECFNGDGGSCFSGSSSGGQACTGFYCPGGVPPEKGTIMSYCHNIFVSGWRQSRYVFGLAGEASEKMTSSFKSFVDGATPNGTITIGSAPLACTSGLTASVTSCANCTYSWQLTGGTITSSTTSNSITFTPTAASVTATVTITNQQGCAITTFVTRSTSCSSLAAPTNVAAAATGPTTVTISWAAPSGASGSTEYQVHRAPTAGGTFTQVCTATHPTVTCNDTLAAATSAYVYKVRAGSTGTFSVIDLATTTNFIDPVLTQGVTTVKDEHVTELRTMIDKVRAVAGLGGGMYSAVASGTTIQKAHITEMRTALDLARSTLVGLGCSLCTPIEYTDGTINQQSTLIKAAHFTDLRNGLN